MKAHNLLKKTKNVKVQLIEMSSIPSSTNWELQIQIFKSNMIY